MAKRTAVGLNEIRKLINVEQKFKETSGSSTYDRAGLVVYLSGLDQGDSTITREGNSVKVQRFHLRFLVKHDSAGTPSASRVLIVRDLQNQGATITAGDVVENTGTSVAPLQFPDFVNGPLQNKRFSIVYDNMFHTDIYNPSYTDSFVSNHDCHVYFRGTDATVASAGNGSYFLVVLNSDTATLLPTIIYNTRIEFTDN